jgi:hypothetical protein
LKTITFDQIKAGDHLKVTTTYHQGTVVTVEGVAHYVSDRSVNSVDGATLFSVNGSFHGKPVTTLIELKHRPTMPFEVGTVIHACLTNNRNGYYVRVEQSGEDDILLWMGLAGQGGEYVSEAEILSWQEMKLVAKDAKVSFE